MTRFSRNRIIAAAGLGEHIPPEQFGRFDNIEVEPGVTTTLVLKPGRHAGLAKPRRVFLVCPLCREEVILGYWDRHQHAHRIRKLDTDKPTQEEEKGDV